MRPAGRSFTVTDSLVPAWRSFWRTESPRKRAFDLSASTDRDTVCRMTAPGAAWAIGPTMWPNWPIASASRAFRFWGPPAVGRMPSPVLAGCGIVCGLAPITVRGTLRGMTGFNRFGLRLAAAAPLLVKPFFLPIAALLKHRPQWVLSSIARRAGQPDRRVLSRPEIRETMCGSFREAMRMGLFGAVGDAVLYSRAWGLHLSEITLPVNLWHGEKDRIVPPAMGRWLAASIPGCRARFYAEEAHFSLIMNRMDAIIDHIRA
jgi:pimeloyl-ACP methyl ester carboxylesterase